MASFIDKSVHFVICQCVPLMCLFNNVHLLKLMYFRKVIVCLRMCTPSHIYEDGLVELVTSIYVCFIII